MGFVNLRKTSVAIGILGLLVIILPGSARASCSCPPEDEAGFPLGQSDLTTNPIFCSYPAFAGENPDDFFCTYNSSSGSLVTDNDAGFCPASTTGCSAPTCGNGSIDTGEQCDDGSANGTAGSCCSATCQFNSSGTSCTDDGNPCTQDVCNGSSDICQHPAGNAGKVCGVAAGPCDVAATCTGSSVTCPPNGKLPDSDGDGVCDAIDVCTNIGGGQNFVAANPKPRLVVGKINTDTVPGNDTLVLTGAFVIHGGPAFSTVDPGTNGARVVVANGAGVTRIDATLPGGAYAGKGTRGWKLSSKGNSWTYMDTTGTPVSGITHLAIVDKSKVNPKNIMPGRVKVTVKGMKGTYPVVAGDEPLKGDVVFGGQPQSEAGYCGETAFTTGNCLFNKKGTAITCKP